MSALLRVIEAVLSWSERLLSRFRKNRPSNRPAQKNDRSRPSDTIYPLW